MRQFLVCLALCVSSCVSWAAPISARALPEDEVVYFVLPDRFENGDVPTTRAVSPAIG